MVCKPDFHELGTARLMYHQLIKSGAVPAVALDFAVIGYLKQNRRVSTDEARAVLAEALGVAKAGHSAVG